MVSVKQQNLNQSIQLMDVLFSTLDDVTYSTIGVVSSIVITVTCLIAYQLSNESALKRLFETLGCGVKLVWSTIRSVLNQHNFETQLWSNRILFAHVVVFIFILIIGYVLNLMKTEYVVQREAHQLDTLEEYLDSAQNWTLAPVLLFKDLFFYGYLQSAKNGTLLGKLKTRAHQYDGKTVIEASTGHGKLGPILNQLTESTPETQRESLVFFIEETVWMNVIQTMMCLAEQTRSVAEKMYESTEKFAASLLVSMYNKRLPPDVVRRHVYNMRTWLETGLTVGSGRYSITMAMAEHAFLQYDTKAVKCIERIKDEESPLIELSMVPLVSTVHWYVAGIIMSMSVFLLEVGSKLVKVRLLVITNDILSNVRYSFRSIVHAVRVVVIYPIQRSFYRGMYRW